MIRVIFGDEGYHDSKIISYDRDLLKYDSFQRMRFAQEVNHAVAHYIGKLRQEVKEENK